MNIKRRRFLAGLTRTFAALGVALAVIWHAGVVRAQAPLDYNTLDIWSFNYTNWVSDYDYAPIGYTNIFAVATNGDYLSLLLDNTNAPAYLNYHVVEPSDGTTNLMVNQGTLIFWFAPDWNSASTNSGTGPGQWGRFIEAGAYTTNASYGLWSVYTDPGGTNIYFTGQTNNGGQATYLSYPITWSSNVWHSIALTYSATKSTLFVDGITMTNGAGVAYYPGANVLSNGFWIGSDYTGTLQARGLFDDIQTIDSPLDSNTVAALVGIDTIIYNNGGYTEMALPPAPSTPSTSAITPDVITGQGNLTLVGSAACLNGTNAYNAWITNVFATTVANGTNVTLNLTFSIVGGSNGVPFDVFANAALSPSSTNYQWAWEGQGYRCNTYTLTNMPLGSVFLVLGTPQSSDGDGLTDAYQLLVTHTNPNLDDQDGAGIPNGWQVLLGLNPLVNQVAQPGTRSTYTYDGGDRLTGISGVKPTSSIVLDNEGNVTTVSQ